MQSESAILSSLILKTHMLMPAEKSSSGWKLVLMAVRSAAPSLTLTPLRFHKQRPRRHDLPGEAEGAGTALSSEKVGEVQEK